MDSYDIVFVGHTATGRIEPFAGHPSMGSGGAAPFAAMAASCCRKRLAVVTRLAQSDEHLLDVLKAAGIDVYAQPASATTHLRVIYPSANVDERQIFIVHSAGFFCIEDMPSFEPCLMHLGGLSNQEFTLEFVRKLKGRRFRLSLDMQGFVWHVEENTGAIRFHDLPEKRELVRAADFVKLDVAEARILTGSDDPSEAAAILEAWGSSETVITRSDGVLARSKGKAYFERFTNRNAEGRTGRGDTTIGAYLAWRIDHSIEDSLRFAAAMASIKMETEGPFRGTLKDVLERMEQGQDCP